MKKSLLVCLLIGGLALSACGTTDNGSSPTSSGAQATTSGSLIPKAGPNQVVIYNSSFNPFSLTVKKGTTVTWINHDSISHSITSDLFNSLEIKSKNAFRYTFTATGSINYTFGDKTVGSGQIVVK